MSQEFTRGDAKGRLGARRILIWAAAGLAAVTAAGIVASVVLAPSPPKPQCPKEQQCGHPPTAPAAGGDREFHSTRLGYRLEYSPRFVHVEKQDASSIELGYEPPNNARIIVEGVPAAEATPEQALQRRIDAFRRDLLGLADDTSPAHEILGPALASRNGIGRALSGPVDSAQGVSTRAGISMMAAGDNELTLVVSVVTTTASESRRTSLLAYADHVLSSLRFPADLSAQGGAPEARSRAEHSQGVVRLGSTDPEAAVQFSLVLRQRHSSALRRYLGKLENPASPAYRHFITADAFGKRFGVSDTDLRQVLAAVSAHGLEVKADYPQRTALDVAGTARSVGRFLGVRFSDFMDREGRHFHAPSGRARLPRPLRRTVVAATGLNDRPVYLSSAMPAGGLKPGDAAAAYNISPLYKEGVEGQGQTIAVISLDSFHDEDVASYDREVGITGAPPVERVPVKGGTRPGSGQDEVNLDIDVIRGIAPRAQIVNYEGPNAGGSIAAILNRIAADGRADIATLSWGICDLVVPEHERLAEEHALQAAAARGITVFVASGDAGAYECQRRNPDDLRLSTPWPAGSKNVVGVGGTTLSVRSDGTYGDESGWEYLLSGGGGGGGLEPKQKRPRWQRGPGVDNADSTGARQVPDVSANSDPFGGWFAFYEGFRHEVGGTSAAAPFWAAAMLLVGQKAEKENAGRLGFVAPILYELAAQKDSPFHDVVRGGNRHYDATPGWDYSTGLGSPNVAKLADQVVAFLKERPR